MSMTDSENLKATYSPALIFETTILMSGKEVPQRIETSIKSRGPNSFVLTFGMCA
jgi:hypothetical protein